MTRTTKVASKDAKTKFIGKCDDKMHKYLKKHKMIITYLREFNPRNYGARPTQQEAMKICEMLNAAPDLTAEGYIALRQIAGELIKTKKIEEEKQKFLTARSYWRSRRTARVGVVVAFKKKDQIYIGWSLCKTTSGDKFNRYIGVYECVRTDADGNYVSAYPIDNPMGTYNITSIVNLIAQAKNELEEARTRRQAARLRPEIQHLPITTIVPHTLLPHVEMMMERAMRQFDVGRTKKLAAPFKEASDPCNPED